MIPLIKRFGLVLICFQLASAVITPAGLLAIENKKITIADFPKVDQPSNSDRKLLENEDWKKGEVSAKYYYGIGVPVDYTKARYAAFIELEKGDGWVFGGSTILMMLYANGFEVNRNLDLAINIESLRENDDAPAEWQDRIAHLKGMKTSTKSKIFDYCDDITSGFMEGHCARIHEEIVKAKRDFKANSVVGAWPQKDRVAFLDLQKGKNAYFAARVQNEVDLSGTGRAAFEIEERSKLEKDFTTCLNEYEKGLFPNYTHEDFKKADTELNAIYSKIMKSTDSEWENFINGTISREDIKLVQREWIHYRDAWAKFGLVRYPKVSNDSWKAWLTKQRINQLSKFIKTTP